MYSMYLKSGREGEIERDLSSVCSLPKWSQWLKLSLSKARNQELLLGLSFGCRVQRLWAIH